MNIFNDSCNPSCDKDNGYDPRFSPLNMDVTNIFHPCPEDCRKPPCKDIQEGVFEFTGPMRVRNLCCEGLKCGVIDDNTFNKNDYIKKSFPIYRVSAEAGCDEIVGAVWRECSGNKSSFTVECAGDYYVKFTWDNCWEVEPKFEAIPVCCDPCA